MIYELMVLFDRTKWTGEELGGQLVAVMCRREGRIHMQHEAPLIYTREDAIQPTRPIDRMDRFEAAHSPP